MNGVTLHDSTGNAQADDAIRGIIGLFELAFRVASAATI
jgi:hypothetical protein